MVISVLRCSLPGIARRFLGTRRPRISRSAVKSGAPFLTTRFFLIVRAPGLAEASPGGGIAPWSGCGGGAAGAKREGCPGRGGAPGLVTGADGRGAGFGSSILPSTRGPRWPSSSDGAASWAEPVRLMVRPAVCGRASPIRRTPEPADGCIRGITGRVPGGCGRGGSTMVRVSGFCSWTGAGARSGRAASVFAGSGLTASGFAASAAIVSALSFSPAGVDSAAGCSAVTAAPLGAACPLGVPAGCSDDGGVCAAGVS